MELVSKTKEEYEGRKFNLYLRAAFLYLMTFIRPSVESVASFSINPVSTYTMYKYFHASNPDLDEYVKANGLTPESFTVSDARKYHTYFSEKYKHTPETAKQTVKEMLEEGYSMEDLGWDSMEEAVQSLMSATNHNDSIISLYLDIRPKEVQDFLLQTLSSIQVHCKTSSIPKMSKKTLKRKPVKSSRKYKLKSRRTSK